MKICVSFFPIKLHIVGKVGGGEERGRSGDMSVTYEEGRGAAVIFQEQGRGDFGTRAFLRPYFSDWGILGGEYWRSQRPT